MRSVLKILLLLAAFPAGGLRAGEIEILRGQLAGVRSRLDSSYLRRDSLEALAGLQSQEVRQLKLKLESGQFAPVDQYRLEARLRASRVLADSLDALSLAVSGLETRAAGLQAEGDSLCGAAIDSLSPLLAESGSLKDLQEVLQEIGKYRSLRSFFGLGTAGVFIRPGEGFGPGGSGMEAGPGDSPEDIREKADFLSDMADKWARRLALVDSRIERIKDERLIRVRIGEFTQELSLFDHGTASSRARVEASGTETPDDMQKPVSREEVFGPEADFPPLAEPSPAGLGRDLELYDLEKSQALTEAVESLSTDDLEGLLRALQARKDSLGTDLDSLRAWGRKLRLKAVEVERERKGSPRQ
ncbi:MAG: hypothetical protein JXQ83_06735 [Candidatus Glassbacteria bacterium]|nr:hypothetical protein [Candidatus Glassbacteria bacterium]